MKLFDPQKLIAQLSIDCVVFGYKEKELKVLVPTLDLVEGVCTLPGGFIYQNESIDQAAHRILRERTGLKNLFLEQFRVFGTANRSNNEVSDRLNDLIKASDAKNRFDLSDIEWLRQRFVSIGYYALVDVDKVAPQKTELDKSIDWYNIADLPKMIMDHNDMVFYALETLRENLDKKLIAFNFLPEKFTMKELKSLYETVYDKPFRRGNFQKKILDLNVLERLGKKYTGAANKAPYLYRFKQG